MPVVSPDWCRKCRSVGYFYDTYDYELGKPQIPTATKAGSPKIADQPTSNSTSPTTHSTSHHSPFKPHKTALSASTAHLSPQNPSSSTAIAPKVILKKSGSIPSSPIQPVQLASDRSLLTFIANSLHLTTGPTASGVSDTQNGQITESSNSTHPIVSKPPNFSSPAVNTSVLDESSETGRSAPLVTQSMSSSTDPNSASDSLPLLMNIQPFAPTDSQVKELRRRLLDDDDEDDSDEETSSASLPSPSPTISSTTEQPLAPSRPLLPTSETLANVSNGHNSRNNDSFGESVENDQAQPTVVNGHSDRLKASQGGPSSEKRRKIASESDPESTNGEDEDFSLSESGDEDEDFDPSVSSLEDEYDSELEAEAIAESLGSNLDYSRNMRPSPHHGTFADSSSLNRPKSISHSRPSTHSSQINQVWEVKPPDVRTLPEIPAANLEVDAVEASIKVTSSGAIVKQSARVVPSYAKPTASPTPPNAIRSSLSSTTTSSKSPSLRSSTDTEAPPNISVPHLPGFGDSVYDSQPLDLLPTYLASPVAKVASSVVAVASEKSTPLKITPPRKKRTRQSKRSAATSRRQFSDKDEDFNPTSEDEDYEDDLDDETLPDFSDDLPSIRPPIKRPKGPISPKTSPTSTSAAISAATTTTASTTTTTAVVPAISAAKASSSRSRSGTSSPRTGKNEPRKITIYICDCRGEEFDRENEALMKLNLDNVAPLVTTPPKATHIIVSDTAERTESVLRAITKGKWVLRYRWYSNLVRFGVIENEEAYEMKHVWPGTRRARLEMEKQGVIRLLEGRVFNTSLLPQKIETLITDLVEATGGRTGSRDATTVVLDELFRMGKHPSGSIPVRFISDCIAHWKSLSIEEWEAMNLNFELR